MRNKSWWLANNGAERIEGTIAEVAEKLNVCSRTLYDYYHEKKKCQGYTIYKLIKIYDLYAGGKLIDSDTDLQMLCVCNGMDYSHTLKNRIGKEIVIRYEWK